MGTKTGTTRRRKFPERLPPGEVFSFKPVERDELREAMRRERADPQLINELEEAVGEFVSSSTKTRDSIRQMRAEWLPWCNETEKLATALYARLDTIRRTEDGRWLEDLLGWDAAPPFRKNPRGPYRNFLRRLRLLQTALSRAHIYIPDHNAKDEARENFGVRVGWALEGAGFKLTKGRDGVLARVLVALYASAGINIAPPFRELKRIVDHIAFRRDRSVQLPKIRRVK